MSDIKVYRHINTKGHTMPKLVIMIVTSIQIATVQELHCVRAFTIRPSLNKMSEKTRYPGCATGRLLSAPLLWIDSANILLLFYKLTIRTLQYHTYCPTTNAFGATGGVLDLYTCCVPIEYHSEGPVIHVISYPCYQLSHVTMLPKLSELAAWTSIALQVGM